MDISHALSVLMKEQRYLDNKIEGISLLEKEGEEINKQMKIIYIQQEQSLKVAIAILEKYNERRI